MYTYNVFVYTYYNIFYENKKSLYIVGGYVRDKILGNESSDIDICTNATPKDIKEIFKTVILPTNEYGSVTVVYNKVRFEITTYRREANYSDNRHPDKIEYVSDLKTDLLRRDFTINTICMDKDGNIIDLLGGKIDIENKVINIHHGFLPAFKGAKPYDQAWRKGVKMIGATAHFANEDLDQGPIIFQDVVRVKDTNSIHEFVEIGKDVERRVLVEGLKKYFNHNVFICNGRTFVIEL